MKNKIYINGNLEPELLVNEEDSNNTLYLYIDADSTATQSAVIDCDGNIQTVTITPSTRNTIVISQAYWNFGGTTNIELQKNGNTVETVYIGVPETIATDAFLRKISSGSGYVVYAFNVYYSTEDAVTDLQTTTQALQSASATYIYPSIVDTGSIADGGENVVLTFAIDVKDANAIINLMACINYTITLTGSSCVTSIIYKLDGTTLATLTETQGAGDMITNLIYQLSGLTTGIHSFTVSLSPFGGAIS